MSARASVAEFIEKIPLEVDVGFVLVGFSDDLRKGLFDDSIDEAFIVHNSDSVDALSVFIRKVLVKFLLQVPVDLVWDNVPGDVTVREKMLKDILPASDVRHDVSIDGATDPVVPAATPAMLTAVDEVAVEYRNKPMKGHHSMRSSCMGNHHLLSSVP